MRQRPNDRFVSKQTFTHRVNHYIKSINVRVSCDDVQLGVMPTSRALAQAQSLGLDLVEIVPNAKPPVCIITDFSKLKYDLGKAEKDKKKKAKQSAVQNEVKELRLSPVIDDGDIDVKIRNAREFLNDKKKVRFVLFFKNRQMQFKDRGYTIVFRVIKSLSDVAEVERQPVLEGKRIICVLKPLLKNN